jgi:hypothetical protein
MRSQGGHYGHISRGGQLIMLSTIASLQHVGLNRRSAMPKHQAPRSWAKMRVIEPPARALGPELQLPEL